MVSLSEADIYDIPSTPKISSKISDFYNLKSPTFLNSLNDPSNTTSRKILTLDSKKIVQKKNIQINELNPINPRYKQSITKFFPIINKISQRKSLFLSENNSPELNENNKEGLYSVISKFYLVRKFIDILKNSTSFRSAKRLNNYQYTLIGDLVNFKNLKFKKNKSFFDLIPVFDPTKNLSLIFDFLVIICIVFLFIEIPFDTSFDFNIFEEYKRLNELRFFSVVIVCLDILRNFNTSYYHKGELITNRLQIANFYLNKGFVIDLISVIPVIIHEKNQNLSTFISGMQYLFFLKIRRFRKLFIKLEELIFTKREYYNFLSLFKLIFGIALITHVLACLWYLIGQDMGNYNNSWLSYYKLTDSDWLTKYLYSFYFIYVTMNTVGYGDISPQNPREVFFAIVFIFFSCIVFAYNINSIGNILKDISKQDNEFRNDLNLANDFMREKGINLQLQMRVRKYLEYIWKEEKIEKVEQESFVLSKLSDSLRDELLLEANGPVIRDIKLFSLNFSEEILRKIVSKMKEVLYTPGDIIFWKGKTNDSSLYVIIKGEIELFNGDDQNKESNKIIRKLKKGEMFGEKSFFTGEERNCSAKSTDFSKVFEIKRNEFLNILEKYPNDFEKFNEIKDKITLYLNNNDLYLKCYSCNSNEHQSPDCPLIHYFPKKDIILQRFIYNPLQPRDENYKRKNSKTKNTLKDLITIEKFAYKLQDELYPRHTSENESDGEEEDSENDENEDEELSENEETIESDIEEETNPKTEKIKRQKQRRRSKRKKMQIFKSLIKREKSISENKLENIEKTFISVFKDIINQSSLHMDKTINNSNNIKIINNEKNENDNELVFDKIATFEEYFIHGNIENILDHIELYKINQFQKKTKTNKNKKKYQIFLKNALDINYFRPEFLHKTKINIPNKAITEYFENKSQRRKNTAITKNFFKKRFFKNSVQIAKMIEEETFSPQKIKSFYENRFKKKNGFAKLLFLIKKFIKNLLKNFLYEREKKVVLSSKNRN